MYGDNYETLGSHEGNQESGEQVAEILYAIHDTDPATGEEFWYIKDDAGNKIPLDVKTDEEGTLREILDDGTLGREVVQDPADDPERVRNLYGPTGDADPDSEATSAQQILPSDQKISLNPISLSAESLANDDPIGADQGDANALASATADINDHLLDSTPDNDLESGNPEEFSQETAAYREKLIHNLDNITASLMQKADALTGLDMPDAARLFAHRIEFIHSAISQELDTSATDFQALVDINIRYFQGEASPIITKISPELDADASTAQFEELLSQVTTIPEITYLADKLVESRHNLKAQKLQELSNTEDGFTQAAIEDELSQSEQEFDPSEQPLSSN